jgi:lipoprotein-anchoring transpeptidase ErfK/SrfK
MAGVWVWLVKRKRQAIVACLALAAFGAWGVAVRSGLLMGGLAWLGLGDRLPVLAAVEPTPSPDPIELTSTEAGPTLADAMDATATRPAELVTQPTWTPTPAPTSTAPATETPTPVAATPEPPPTPVPSYARTLTPAPSPAPPASPAPTEAGNRRLVVDQDLQEMQVYEGDQLVRTIPVSTGAPYENSFTPSWSGVVGPFWGKAQFRGTDLWADYIWFLFPGAKGSILIHSVPYANNGEEKVYDRPEALGVEPASKGCVRISPEDAEWLAGWDPVGVPIEITRYSGVIQPAPDTP